MASQKGDLRERDEVIWFYFEGFLIGEDSREYQEAGD